MDLPAPSLIVGRHCVYTLFNPPSSPRVHNSPMQALKYLQNEGLQLRTSAPPVCKLDPGIFIDDSPSIPIFINHYILWFHLLKGFWICCFLFLFWPPILPNLGLKWIGSHYLLLTLNPPTSIFPNSSHPGYPVTNCIYIYMRSLHDIYISCHWVISLNKNLQLCITCPINFKLLCQVLMILSSSPKLPNFLSHWSPAKIHTSLSHTRHLHPSLVPLSLLSLQPEQLLSVPHPSYLALLSRCKSGFPSRMKLFLDTSIPSRLSFPSIPTQPRAGPSITSSSLYTVMYGSVLASRGLVLHSSARFS